MKPTHLLALRIIAAVLMTVIACTQAGWLVVIVAGTCIVLFGTFELVGTGLIADAVRAAPLTTNLGEWSVTALLLLSVSLSLLVRRMLLIRSHVPLPTL